MDHDPETESWLHDLFGSAGEYAKEVPDTFSQFIEKCDLENLIANGGGSKAAFNNLRTELLGEDAMAEPLKKHERDDLSGPRNWDCWYGPEAGDCPASGPGYYRKVGGSLVKI